jgi:hypothetical protein
MTNRENNVKKKVSDLPQRKKPAVRKTAAKNVPIEVPVVEEKSKHLKPNPNVILTAILALSIGLIGGYQLGKQNSQPKVDMNSESTFTSVVAGKVALDENQLISAVKKVGATVYWAGPVKGAKYTLSVPGQGQAYVRYLPDGKGIDDTNPNYVVIATYQTENAFTATQSAGNQTNGVTFVNVDGAAVYYSKDTPTNVYVAYPGKNYQIEIFNPISKTALDIASNKGALRQIG